MGFWQSRAETLWTSLHEETVRGTRGTCGRVSTWRLLGDPGGPVDESPRGDCSMGVAEFKVWVSVGCPPAMGVGEKANRLGGKYPRT